MRRALSVLSVAVLSTAIAGSAFAATSKDLASRSGSSGRAGNVYKVKRLVADQPGHAKATDPNLVNAWGLAAGPTTPWWVNAADSDVSTLYDGTGAIIPLVVDVAGGPTGLVYNGSTDFTVTNGSASGPSVFLFSTEGGTINGWNPAVPAPSPSTRSFVVADRTERGCQLQGPRDRLDSRRQHAVRHGLPQRQGRHVR